MVLNLGSAKIKTTQSCFNDYVLFEREQEKADILVMSYNTFDEIDLLEELEFPQNARLRKIAQLSLDDECTIFCGYKASTEGKKTVSVAVAHRGKICDIVDRTTNLGEADFVCGDKLGVYNTVHGKIAVLIGVDASQDSLWEKIAITDYVICFVEDDTYNCQISKLATKYSLTTIIVSHASSLLVES